MAVRPWAVGLFVVGGLALLTVILFIIGNRQQAFVKHLEFQTQFSNLSGLSPGAKVRVAGIDAGKIKAIVVPRSASEKFRLTLEVEEKVHGMVRANSLVTIETEGVVGDKYLLIKRGTDQAEEAKKDAMLPSKEPFELSAMMDKANGLLTSVNDTIGDVRARVDVSLDTITKTINHADGLITDNRPNVSKITRDASRITSNIDLLVADVNAGKGPAGLLLRDEETKRQLQATLANVNQASADATDAVNHADQLIKDFQSRGLGEKTQATLENAQALSGQLNVTVKDALAPDTMGEDASTNIRESLSNLNRSTANLADDTEALKHNFFLRGFFKKRGIFNTDQITPAEYRTTIMRHKQPVVRMWLQASNLVSYGPDGKEHLTEDGRQQIDSAVAPQIDSLAGRLIVVEGYATVGTPAEQFDIGRQRAGQVRRYLEVRYHLRHSDIGVVTLGGTPPQNAGKTSWDGASVVLLERKVK